LGDRPWINQWEDREERKDQNQKELDQKLKEAARNNKWDEMALLMGKGATDDYVREYGSTAYYWTLLWVNLYNDEGAKKLLIKYEQRWKNENEKNWAIKMARKEYYEAAEIIGWTKQWSIVANSKHPIVGILRMMGEDDWEEEYGKEILKITNLRSALTNDLHFMIQEKIVDSEEFRKNFSHLAKMLKRFKYEVEYNGSAKKFKTNFDISRPNQTPKPTVKNTSIQTPKTRQATNDESILETVLKENTKLHEQIRRLEISKNAEIQTLKRAIFRKDAEIQNLKDEIKQLKIEKIFQKPTQEEEKKVRDQFQNSRNVHHNVAPYQIKVQKYFSLLFLKFLLSES
jgi:hypothetical protein